ncbi:MAG: hypothetical protein K2O04_05140 [Clostridiales bacterium]|nr:hypothetical protein [Clostridiales bacterium]
MMKNSNRLTRRGGETSTAINCKAKVFGVVTAMLLLLCATVLGCIFFMPKTSAAVQAETGDVAEVSYIDADEQTKTDVYTSFAGAWNAALAKPAATIKLLQDVVLTDKLAAITTGKNITLDLNDKVLNLNGAYSANKSSSRNIKITGGTFNLIDDAEEKTSHSVNSAITNNAQETITGGVITGGYAEEYGGGVSLSSGTFNMSGGSISANKAYSTSSGGGVSVEGGVFEMTGGTISYNNASGTGGGVHTIIPGKFIMKGSAEISHNKSGGVSVGAKYSNKEYLGSTFVMEGGIISENIGGGVSVGRNSTFQMSGGEISGNTLVISARGVGVNPSLGSTIELSGSPIIQNNVDKDGVSGNLFLNTADADYSQQKVKIVGPLSADARIGVSLSSYYKGDNVALRGQKYTGVFTEDYDKFTHGADFTTIFSADNAEYYIDLDIDGKELEVRDDAVKFEVKQDGVTKVDRTFSTFKEAWLAVNAAEGSVELTLLKNITVGAGSTNLGSGINKNVTLDLNGKVLNLNGDGTVNGVYNRDVRLAVGDGGELTLIDGAPQAVNKVTGKVSGTEKTVNGGVITGGLNGCVYVTVGGTFNMNGGTMIGNEASYGGGVNVHQGTFNMNDGAIIDNQVTVSGGGVYVKSGTFNMEKGVISDNAVDYQYGNGGGVYVCDGGKFNMNDGDITGNKVSKCGGGVGVNGATSKFTMTNGTISGNTADDAYCGGGGVHVSAGTFDMSAGKITGNYGRAGSGVGLYSNATFNMSGTAEISNNTAGTVSQVGGNGGGVYVYSSTFNMSGGTISENKAVSYSSTIGQGGGVIVSYSNSLFKFEGGKITGNTAAVGGGVYVSGGFEMSGTAEISKNKAVRYNNLHGTGGGVHIQGSVAEFTMTGGTISDNTAGTTGGGVYVSTVVRQFKISGSPKIYGNYLHDDNEEKTSTLTNVFLTLDAGADNRSVKVKINVEGELTAEATIGVGIDGQEFNGGLGVFTTNFANGNIGASVFKPDKVGYYVLLEGEECTITDELPFEVIAAELDGVLGTYTAGDKAVRVNIRRTLKNNKTNDISYDTVDHTVAVSPLHAGIVPISFVYEFGTFTSNELSTNVNVAQKEVSLSWYYDNAPVVTKEKSYDGADSRGSVSAKYVDIYGTVVTVSGADLNMTYTGAATTGLTELKNAGSYAFSIKTAELSDYVFTNNSFTVTVNRVGIDLSDASAFYWKLDDRAQGLKLRTGDVYIYTVNGNPQYYYNEQSDLVLDRKISVVESIVRYRNTELTIVFNADNANVNVRYDVNSKKDVGAYTSYASLGLNDNINYYYYLGSTIDQNRGMKIDIGTEGKTATVTKNWYIVNISNALLSQNGIATYGQEYDIADWTYGDDVIVYAPRLEHGDEGEYNSTYTFEETDNKVMFELYRRDVGSTGEFTKIGEPFNRYAFQSYINKSMPSGEYRLNVSAEKVSLTSNNHVHWWNGEAETGSMLYFEPFTQVITFRVSRATSGFSVQDGIKGKKYTYSYDGKVHLYKDDALTVTTTGAPTRSGVWAGVAYGAYYDIGEVKALAYYLELWDEYVYRTEAELEDFTEDESIRPVGMGEYKVYYRAAFKNYSTSYGGGEEHFFTVVINQGQFDLGTIEFEDGAFKYDEKAHSIFVTNAPDFIKVEYVGNGKTEAGTYTVTAKLSTDNDAYVLVGKAELTATLTIFTEFDLGSITFEDGTFVYNDHEHSIFVKGAPSFIKVVYDGNEKTEVGTYTVTAKLSADDKVYKLVGNPELTATLTILAKTLEVVKDEEPDKVWVSAENDKGFESNIELSVKELPNYKNDKIEENIEAAYDISLKKGNESVTPAGRITISLLIPEDLRKEDFAILQVKSNSAEPVSFVRSGDYAMFTVDSLSPFVFVKSSQSPSAAPESNDNSMWWIWVVIGVLALLIIILLLVLLLRRKKKVYNIEQIAPQPAPAPAAAPAASTDTNSDATEAANKIAEAAAIVAEAAAKVAEAKLGSAQAKNAAAPQAATVEVTPAPTPAPAPAPAPAPTATPVQSDDDEITPEVDDDDMEVPSDDGFAGAFEASSAETVTYSQSVLSKLISSTDVVKNRYSELKNYLLSYKKARANMSRSRESFYIGRNCYARIAVRGKTLCVYLALDPQKYAGTKYNVEDVLGVKSYADTPCLIRIKSERALKYAKELIDELMHNIEAEKSDRAPSNYVELFKSIEMLQKKKLISCSGNKKKK